MRASNPDAAGLMAARMEAAARAMDQDIAPAFTAAVRARGTSFGEFRTASGAAAELLIDAGKFADAVPLLDFACRASAEYSRTRRINAAMMVACLARLGRFDDEARAGAQAEIARGRVLLAYGADPSGITEFALSKLYELLGQPVEALSYRERALVKNPELDRRWPRELSPPAPSRSTR